MEDPNLDSLGSLSFQNFIDGLPEDTALNDEELQKDVMLCRFKLGKQFFVKCFSGAEIGSPGVGVNRVAHKILQISNLREMAAGDFPGLWIAVAGKIIKVFRLFLYALNVPAHQSGCCLTGDQQIEQSAQNRKTKDQKNP